VRLNRAKMHMEGADQACQHPQSRSSTCLASQQGENGKLHMHC
jgi:hypothetical protein